MTCLEPKEEPVVLDQPENKVRPLFSIVISCYNSRSTLGRLLDSLCWQGLEKNEYEIIISDDHSTESYEDIISLYKDKLNIIRTSTEYNCCPSNTREAGAQAASGVWLTFSDHDDVFYPGALQKLRDEYLLNPEFTEEYYIVTSFREIEEKSGTVIREHIAESSGGWTHGKFYNMDKLWKPFNIHYLKDLKSHEDIYITCTVNCILHHLNQNGIKAGSNLNNLFTYIWYHRQTSQSHAIEPNQTDFLHRHFIDYIKASGEVYFEQYYKGVLDEAYTRSLLIDSIMLCYFYSESFIFKYPTTYNKENFTYLKDYIKRIKDTFGINNNFIWQYEAGNQAYGYIEAEKNAQIATGGIIPHLTFIDWLDLLASDGDVHKPKSIFYEKGFKEINE